MKTSFRQKLLIAVGLSAGLLASMNLFAQENANLPAIQHPYAISSQSDYLKAVSSINELASKLYRAHSKYPQLAYSHVYNSNGELMGFTVEGVSQSSVADEISGQLMELEVLGNAIHSMNDTYLPESKNSKLSSRVSKKRAMQSMIQQESDENTVQASGSNPNDLNVSLE